MNTQNAKYIIIRTIRFCIAAALYAIVFSCSYWLLQYSYARSDYGLETPILYVTHIGLCLLVYHSYFHAIILTDRAARTRYFEAENTAKNKVGYILTSIEFWIHFVGTLIQFATFPKLFAVTAWSDLLSVPPFLAYLLTFASSAVVLFLTWMMTIRQWHALEAQEKAQFKRKNMTLMLIVRATLLAPMYMFVAPLVPTLLVAAISLVRIVVTFWWLILIVVLVLAVLCIAVPYLRALLIRRKFLQNLRKVAERRGYKISEIAHPYASLFTDHDGSSFTIAANGKRYACKLLSCLNYGNAMYLGENGQGANVTHINYKFVVPLTQPFAHLLYRGGTWAQAPDDLMRFQTSFTYGFEGEGKKVLIVCPTPYKIFAGTVGNTRQLDVGDKVYEYTLMTGTGFLNALERDCI